MDGSTEPVPHHPFQDPQKYYQKTNIKTPLLYDLHCQNRGNWLHLQLGGVIFSLISIRSCACLLFRYLVGCYITGPVACDKIRIFRPATSLDLEVLFTISFWICVWSLMPMPKDLKSLSDSLSAAADS